MITADRLRQVLDYNHDSGLFVRKLDSGRWKPGQIAGNVHKRRGYWMVGIDGASYLGHRLAWLYVTGKWPKQDLDHIDGDILNNRFSNLREVTEIVNAQNQRRAHKGSKSGLLGVYPRGERWQSTICVNKTPHYLGTFDTKEAAFAAYLDAKRRLHVGCTI
jgi:hypothetical protein